MLTTQQVSLERTNGGCGGVGWGEVGWGGVGWGRVGWGRMSAAVLVDTGLALHLSLDSMDLALVYEFVATIKTEL